MHILDFKLLHLYTCIGRRCVYIFYIVRKFLYFYSIYRYFELYLMIQDIHKICRAYIVKVVCEENKVNLMIQNNDFLPPVTLIFKKIIKPFRYFNL